MAHVDQISQMRIFSSRYVPGGRCCSRGGRWTTVMWNNLRGQVNAAPPHGSGRKRQGSRWRKGLERFALHLAEVNQLQHLIDELHVSRVCLAYEIIRNT